MVPSSNVLIFFLLCMAAYGETRTISSTANSTDLESETSTEKISNDTCTNSNECGGKLFCDDGVCQCPADLLWNGIKCILRKSINDACMKEEECRTNLHCAKSVCQCASSDYWTGSTCSIRKDEKALCNSPLECKATLQCRNNHCGCCEQDFWNGQFCERTKDENALCNSSIECKATLQCRNHHCGCCEKDFWNGQFCEENICAVELCMNDGKCKISENRHRCECADGYLGDKCQYADGREKDFIVIFQESFRSPSPRILPTVNRSGTLSVFYFTTYKNVSVTFNSVDNHYNLDSNVLMTNGLHQAGAVIHSNVPINLYGFLFVRSYSEGFFVIPTRYASTDYIIPSFTPHNKFKSMYSVFAFSSVYSNTVIEINFKIKDWSVSYDNIQYSNNQTLTLVLNKYTTFQIWHTSDLTGTRIIASKPVVAVSGNVCNVINYAGDCQPFIEMVLPTNQLDNVYVIPHLNYQLENTVRVIAVNDTNVVLKNGDNRTTNVLKSRDFFDYFHTTISCVSSATDVMVHIYSHELSGRHGDAFMMTIPGINQYLYDYDFMVPTDFESFVSITVPTNAVDGFVLDGNVLNLTNIYSISEEEYHFSSFSTPISSGSHHITHTKKTRFGLWVYGNYSTSDAYGYPAGMAFKT
ncbi:uncharacterized protein LOC134721434 isoform X2 [Mytilus trossulus]|uniref:uncharacterized protein LOC134721434 isoform X2 n=1 Tax=Mytilus trossulus TaxID=6551 RepID=UPI003007BEC4